LTGRSDVAVVHLVRHTNGFEPFEAFISSYERFGAGREHDLVLLFKGFREPREADRYLERAAAAAPGALHVSDRGLDLTAYMAAAARLDHGRVCFVNSFSEILADGWLERLSAPLDGGRVGAAGATGSWGSHLAFKLLQVGIAGGYADVFPDRRELRLALHDMSGAQDRGDVIFWLGNAFYTVRDFAILGLFPSVHLRTNAFVVGRERLLGLRTGRLRSKRATYRLESGRGSLTAQLAAQGRPSVVVDRHGAVREAPEWHAGDVFWQARQQDLLVADNQTRQYDAGLPEHRDVLSRLAWGLQARPWLGDR
jgi:hypothetical protein